MKRLFRQGARVLVQKGNPYLEKKEVEWLGPFEVSRVTNGGAIELKDGKKNFL